jgi:hypothetical protein
MIARMSASTFDFVFRSYNPFLLRPEAERRAVLALGALAAILWLLVVPLELALAS